MYENQYHDNMKILIAEDNELILKVVETKLKKDGHEVVSCENGRDAIEKLMHFQPDVIITDIMLPFKSGLEIISFAKKKFSNRVSVIVLSSLGQEKTVEEAFHLGADDYMTKPFSLPELSVRLKRFSRVPEAA